MSILQWTVRRDVLIDMYYIACIICWKFYIEKILSRVEIFNNPNIRIIERVNCFAWFSFTWVERILWKKEKWFCQSLTICLIFVTWRTARIIYPKLNKLKVSQEFFHHKILTKIFLILASNFFHSTWQLFLLSEK